MEVFGLWIDNPTLVCWASELRSMGHRCDSEIYINPSPDQKLKNANQAKEWFRVVDKLGRHFVSFLQQPSVREFILDTFPIRVIVDQLWVQSSTQLSSFFGTTFAIYDESFHLELVSRYQEIAWTLKNIPFLQESMPALNSLLILMN